MNPTINYTRSMSSHQPGEAEQAEAVEIPLRELRNNISKILADVEAGKSFRVTVRGRPVADLLPVQRPRRFATWADVNAILRDAPLDANFERDVGAALGGRIDDEL